VPLIDPRTGLIDRAWYMFFLALFDAAQIANGLLLAPNTASLLASYDAALQALAQNVNTQPAPVDLSAELIKQIQAASLEDCCSGLVSQVAEMQKQLEALNLLPLPPESNLTNGTSILYGNGSGGFSNVALGSGVSFVAGVLSATGSGGTITSVTATAPVASSGGFTPNISLSQSSTSTDGYLSSTDWNTFNGKGSGTVTNVSFTGGIITVANPTTTPAFTVAGTSGGIPYFSSGTTWASSAALTQYGVVYGGGAGATPVATSAGTTGQVLTATTGGAPTWASPATGGTVTSVSVVSANGFAGTVATATTTPAITLTTSITGLLKGNGTAISAAVANTDYMGVGAPITKTADFTVANGEIWYINNKSGSTCTVTLPAASSWTGRNLTFKNMQAQTLVSASSNVVPIDSTSAGTAILLAVVGNWATMVSDGTNWIIMQRAANNCLLLE
jgi:hypothetical protein